MKNLIVEAAYLGSRGEHIWNNFTRNATFPQYLSMGTQLNNLVPNPFFGKIATGAMSAAQVRQGSLLVPYPQYSGVSQTRASIGAACSFAGATGLGCYADRLKDGNLPSGQRSMNQWFDTTAYASPAAYSFGSGSRTEPDLRNPVTISFDSVMSRWQPIRERMRLQFRAELYNILNHPNLGAPSASITSSTYGQIASKSGNRTVTTALRLEF